MQTIFCSGPMTGKPFHNHREFVRTQKLWEERGWKAITPFDTNNAVWREKHGRDMDPYKDDCQYGDPLMAELIDSDLKAVFACDAIAVLPGWEQSKGAQLEVLLARNLGKPIYEEGGRQITPGVSVWGKRAAKSK